MNSFFHLNEILQLIAFEYFVKQTKLNKWEANKLYEGWINFLAFSLLLLTFQALQAELKWPHTFLRH